MKKELRTAANDLKKRFEGQVSESANRVSVTLVSKHILEVCQALKKEHKFEMLVSQTAVDYWPQTEPRFHLVYQFYSLSQKLRLEVRARLDGDEPSLDSVQGVYPNANWFERELWDLFGIKFEGHPDMRRLIMPHDWQGHPLRKDYPLGYEEVQFTFNFDDIDLRKPRPKN